MNPIQTAYVNALLADASYVTGIEPGTLNPSKFAIRLTPTQAAYLAANFTVVTSIESPKTLDTGFDAVLWQIKAGSGLAGSNNENAGKIFVSMRGTQGGTDLLDDLELATRGIPYEQIRDMVNWWLKSTAAVTNTDAKQIKVIKVPGLIGAKTFALDTPTTGTGVLTELDGIAGVNGHSLGGYLATAFARIFGGAWGVEKVNTYNSAGFSNAAGLNIAYEYDSISSLLGSNMGMSFNSVAPIQSNFLGANGTNFTTNSAGDIGLPGFNQYGQRVGLYQEDLLTGGAAPINNHSMYKLTDYLALGAALEKFDASLNIDRLNTLIKAGSNDMAGSYEGVLDAIRRVIDGAAVAPLGRSDVSDNTPPRENLHAAFAALLGSPVFQSIAGKVTLNASLSNIATQAKARLGFEEIVALETLAPFVLNATGAAGKTAMEALWLGQPWSTKYQAWLADKASLQTGGLAVAYTDSWINDRAALLMMLQERNKKDIASNLQMQGIDNINYQDIVSAQTISVRRGIPNSGTQIHQVKFGGEGADPLSGQNLDDRLYGGAGADTLDGKGGADYLEGGEGLDTYNFSGEFGTDTIVDSDGSGKIIIDGGVQLTGGKKLSATVWLSNDRKTEFHLAGGTQGSGALRILRAGNFNGQNSITVRNWKPGDLGITLPPDLIPASERSNGTLANGQPRTATSRRGDRLVNGDSTLVASANRSDVLSAFGVQWADDSIGISPQTITLSGRPSFTAYGYGGNDALVGGEASDYLSGGDGNDFLMGGEGSDTLIGGAGNDIIGADLATQIVGIYPGHTANYSGPAGINAGQILARGDSWAVFKSADGALRWDSQWGTSPGNSYYTNANADQFALTLTSTYDGAVPYAASNPEYGNDIDAGAGDDIVLGGFGSDSIELGADNDIGFGGHGHDDIFGSGGDDHIYGDRGNWGYWSDGAVTCAQAVLSGNDYLDGGSGADQIYGDLGSDILIGGTGNDYLIGDYDASDRQFADSRLVEPTWGPATFAALAQYYGDDWLDGGADDDWLDGGRGNDTLYGGTGNDWLFGGEGDDYLNGGGGRDYLVDNQGNNTFVAGARVMPQGNLMMSRLDGGSSGDALLATLIEPPDTVFISGGQGDDLIIVEANAGEVVIVAPSVDEGGGGGNDRLQIAGTRADWSIAMSGKDLLISAEGGSSVRIQGYRGADDGSASLAAQAFSDGVEFEDGTGLSPGEIATIVAIGTQADDWLYGSALGETLDGLGGDDRIFGRSGDDVLLGGDGNDELTGGDGVDMLQGGAGDDTYVFLAGTNLLGLPKIDVIEDTQGTINIRVEGLPSFDELSAQSQDDGSVILRWRDGGVRVVDGVARVASVQIAVAGQSKSLCTVLDAVVPSHAVPVIERRTDLDAGNADFLYAQQVRIRDGIDLAASQGLLDTLPWTGGTEPVWKEVVSNEALVGLNGWFMQAEVRPVYQTTEVTRDLQGNVVEDSTTQVVLDLRRQDVPPSGEFLTRAYLESVLRSRGQYGEVMSWSEQPLPDGGPDDVRFTVSARRADLVTEQSTAVVRFETVQEIQLPSGAVNGRFGDRDNRVKFNAGMVAGGAGNDSIQSYLFWARNRAEYMPTGMPPLDMYLAQLELWNARNARFLTGETAATFMDGGDGNDVLAGGALADVLYGGRGFNRLYGFAGPDRYLVLDEGPDTGWDYIADQGVYGTGLVNVSHELYGGPEREFVPEGVDIDTVEFGPGITRAGVRFALTQAATDPQAMAQGAPQYVTVTLADGRRLAAIEISAPEYLGSGVEYLQFQDGTRISVAQILEELHNPVVNHAPVIGIAATDAATLQGEPFTLQLASDLFTDTDAADVLTWSVRRDDGDPLPAWLSFDPATRTLTGTPANADAEALGLRISVTDLAGVTASQNFTLTVNEVAGAIITGTNDPDNLIGTAGDDTIDGLGRADTLTGGDGDDVYVVDNTRDVVIETPNHGHDRIDTRVSYTLPANVEAIALLGTANLRATGNELDNELTGNSGANRLDGAGGADRMAGGAGNDVYVVDDANDTVVETAGQGTDTVLASVSHTLAANVERLTLTGAGTISGTGNALANLMVANDAGSTLSGLDGNDTLRGGAGADILLGGEGNDRLEGRGGADRAEGGRGNDTYVVEDAGDTVIEQAAEGTDTVQAAVSFTLGANVERLILTGAQALDGVGNEVGNILTGNAAANTLSGLDGNDTLRGGAGNDTLLGGEGNDRLEGGAGADSMEGGAGNDTYIVDEAGDQTLELADQGTDTVQAVISHTLGANIERLTLSGIDAIAGTGNELANILTGNDAANVLRGLAGADTLRGGAGADTLDGGAGNDRLEGGTGADLYLFGRGDGQDTLLEDDANEADQDVLRFGEGIDASQLWFRKQGDHLDVTIIGSGDRVRVSNWYLGEEHHVEQFQLANGQHLLDSQVQNLVQAMASFAPPAAGQTSLPAGYQSSLQPVIAANWQ